MAALRKLGRTLLAPTTGAILLAATAVAAVPAPVVAEALAATLLLWLVGIVAQGFWERLRRSGEHPT